jgi:hypothetical protein
MVNLLAQFSDEMANIAAKARQSVVRIVGAQGSIGAGTIWHSDGLIITNAHVVSRGDVAVLLPSEKDNPYPAQVLAYDREQDIAALYINAINLPTINVGDSRSVRAGEWVMALGHPWGIRDSLTAGIVIGAGADLPDAVRARMAGAESPFASRSFRWTALECERGNHWHQHHDYRTRSWVCHPGTHGQSVFERHHRGAGCPCIGNF